MEEELDPTPDDTVSNSNGDILEVNVENLRQSSLANLAARMQLENSIDSDGLARVLVLYTGGTIGMVHKSGGYEPEANTMVSKLCSLPIFHDPEFVKKHLPVEDQQRFLALPTMAKQKGKIIYEVKEFNPLLDSSNMTREDWIKIAQSIEEHYDQFDGFVVLHGTDTMAYTASALSFMCEHLGKPIILTGSQIPIYEVRSDGRDNFLGSLVIAGGYHIPEVLLCFNEKVFRGNRSIKFDTSSFTAFASPNMPPLVSLEIDIHVDWQAVYRSCEMQKFKVHTNMCQNVGILRLFPGITIQTVKAFLQPPMQGVVLQTYGAGNAPSNRADIIELFKEATKWGVLIVNITQCSRGNVKASYATGKALEEAGVIPGGDMTPEAALCKLSYVLGKDDWTSETRRKMLACNLRGEMTTAFQDSASVMDSGVISDVARALSLSTTDEISKLREALFPTLFCVAARAADIGTLENLINSGADVSSINHDGRTALHVACSMGNVRLVQYLLNHGASVHVRDHRGDSPLIDAVLAKNVDVIRLLVLTGAVMPWPPGRIAVHLCGAAAMNDLTTLKAWQAAGADLNVCDYDFRTALHIAVSGNRKEIVKFLTDHGARSNLQDMFGLTPLTIAQKLGHSELVEIMHPGGPPPPLLKSMSK